MLDRHRTRSALQTMENLKRKKASEMDAEIDADGRLIIHEERDPKMEKAFHRETDARSEAAGSRMSVNSKRSRSQKRQKTSESGWAYMGSEYASKKAGGDVKRKDKLEPYAYWPLDRKMMSRRPQHRAAATKGMASVVKMTKKLEGKSASGSLAAAVKKGRKKSSSKRIGGGR